MDEPFPKRQRFNGVSGSSIHKPFRSPLKAKTSAINQQPTPLRNASHAALGSDILYKTDDPKRTEHAPPYLPSRTAHSILDSPGTPHLPEAAAAIIKTSPSRKTAAPATVTTTTTKANSSPARPTSTSHTPTHPSLQLSALRHDVDTLKQSLRLRSSPRDAELSTLISNWRTVARAAAEELYGSARDKVNGMGGVGGWRAREEAAVERRRRWEVEAQEEETKRVEREEGMEDSDSDDDEDREEEGEGVEKQGESSVGNDPNMGRCRLGEENMSKVEKRQRREEVRDARREAKEARMGEKSEYDEGWAKEREREEKKGAVWAREGDGGFTMDMMLRTMSIDLKMIGWDEEAQRWIDD